MEVLYGVRLCAVVKIYGKLIGSLVAKSSVLDLRRRCRR